MLPSANFVQPISPESSKATYSAGVKKTTFAATATDIIQLIGSTSKTIKLARVQITADATAAGILELYLVKRTAANTGGTAAAITGIAHDTQDPAYTATLQEYSANPSALGAGQIIRIDGYALPSATTTGYPFSPYVFTFGVHNGKMPTLHGVAESISINLNGQAIPSGLNLWVDIEWTEE